LAQNSSNTVNLVGGILRPGIESVVGPWSERFLQDVRIKSAFVSCSGFTPDSGMTEVDVYEAQFRVKAIEVAGQVLALIDSSKFGKLDLTPSVRIEQIGHLFTDSGLSAEWAARLRQAGIAFTICGDARDQEIVSRNHTDDGRWTMGDSL
jgi:DeoR family fructose operon transcriptional repressor